MEDLRYPIGRWERRSGYTPEEIRAMIGTVETTPAALREAVAGLDDLQLDTPYRPEGWTVRQVAHHLPDSHMNAYVRMKLALTEDEPAVKGYEEAVWARLPDSMMRIEPSLDLLEALHQRWIALLRSLKEEQWQRVFHHSELGPVALETNLGLYAWHGPHHVAHITGLRERQGW